LRLQLPVGWSVNRLAASVAVRHVLAISPGSTNLAR
jgi:hypothetical protein